MTAYPVMKLINENLKIVATLKKVADFMVFIHFISKHVNFCDLSLETLDIQTQILIKKGTKINY